MRQTFLVLALLALLPGRVLGQTLTPSQFVLRGLSEVQLAGDASYYAKGLAARHVGGQLRLLQIVGSTLYEFVPPAIGARTTTATRTWDLRATGALDDFVGISYEEAKGRLWVTSSRDYNAQFIPAHITTMTLNDDGSVGNVHRVLLQGLPDKRVYGTVIPSPVAGSDYCALGGGYTSLVEQGGNASLGPAMYCFADPAGAANGATMPVRTILDAAPQSQHRGVRATTPINYFDDGDPRPNPSTPPTAPPASSARWLSTGGTNYMVWGDSAYGTGMAIPVGGKLWPVEIWSLCKGRCWYQSSTLHFDGRQFEIHAWDPASLGTGALTRPTWMSEIVLPKRGIASETGDVPTENVGGAAYADGMVWLISCGQKQPSYTGCYLYRVEVTGATSTPPPVEPPPVEPPPVTPPTPTVVSTLVVKTCRLTMTAAKSPDGTSGWKVQFSRNPGVHQGRTDSSAPYGPMGANLNAGTYHLSAAWTKTGQPTIMQDLGTVTCR